MNTETILSILGTLGFGAGVAGLVKAHYILPVKIEQLERLHAAEMLLLAEKTKVIADDHDRLVRIDEWVAIQKKSSEASSSKQ